MIAAPLLAAVRRHVHGAWHVVPAVELSDELHPIGPALCGRDVPAADVVDVAAPSLVDELLRGVECCRPCRVAALEGRS